MGTGWAGWAWVALAFTCLLSEPARAQWPVPLPVPVAPPVPVPLPVPMPRPTPYIPYAAPVPAPVPVTPVPVPVAPVPVPFAPVPRYYPTPFPYPSPDPPTFPCPDYFKFTPTDFFTLPLNSSKGHSEGVVFYWGFNLCNVVQHDGVSGYFMYEDPFTGRLTSLEYLTAVVESRTGYTFYYESPRSTHKAVVEVEWSFGYCEWLSRPLGEGIQSNINNKGGVTFRMSVRCLQEGADDTITYTDSENDADAVALPFGHKPKKANETAPPCPKPFRTTLTGYYSYPLNVTGVDKGSVFYWGITLCYTTDYNGKTGYFLNQNSKTRSINALDLWNGATQTNNGYKFAFSSSRNDMTAIVEVLWKDGEECDYLGAPVDGFVASPNSRGETQYYITFPCETS